MGATATLFANGGTRRMAIDWTHVLSMTCAACGSEVSEHGHNHRGAYSDPDKAVMFPYWLCAACFRESQRGDDVYDRIELRVATGGNA